MRSILKQLLIPFLFIFFSCNNHGKREPDSSSQPSQTSNITVNTDGDVMYIQNKADSASHLYKQAIDEYNRTKDRNAIVIKYAMIKVLKMQVSSKFDSITHLYTAGEISQANYDKVKSSLKFDSVKYYQKECQKMGLIFR